MWWDDMKFTINFNKKHLYILSAIIALLIITLVVLATASPGKPAYQMGHSSLFTDTIKSYYTSNTITIGDDATSKLSVTGDLNVGSDLTVVGKIVADNVGEAAYNQSTQGSITPIPEDVLIRLCGDIDGCEFRMGIIGSGLGNGDYGAVAGLFHYNKDTKQYRSDYLAGAGMVAWGTNADGSNKDIWNPFSWGCIFTDYSVIGDAVSDTAFGLKKAASDVRTCWISFRD
jgi:hypothetical protein